MSTQRDLEMRIELARHKIANAEASKGVLEAEIARIAVEIEAMDAFIRWETNAIAIFEEELAQLTIPAEGGTT